MIGDPVQQIVLRVVYVDEHLLQLECQALVGPWSAVAQAYTTRRDVGEFAAELGQFSATLQDKRLGNAALRTASA